MRRLLIFILIFLIIVTMISACEGIDINSDSVKELEKLSGVGPVKAEAIVKSRPFESVDDLIKVYGIGDATLDKIKYQGLACVDDLSEEEVEENKVEIKEVENLEIEDMQFKKTELDVINLNTKDIKTEENKKLDKTNYVKYGFVMFCTLLGFLFVLKRKKIYKTEFDNGRN